ncbi:HipA N-terminal domain-containing protein [Cytophagaceae bacterium DM2B3-1]|uniref:HipA N-terminal domain-containing protein n=1 Tax=Xanthocytophaga flava TaxID=3048013 RepID=A0AAE3U8F5_9BACT|nr:HipA N-terminal domain-containing protein [Xanthocytophaga flavus]MDJ1471852.1 HipA N-terminal domain-containing protein [Xanthocytophaga flavus]MDJ1480634.1 HipA N-terminal domain-containing protein [Xanthocytophaga flavus]MDJ1497125.1 HipA N-terminal domain-containing protein [Xanthocytophaga flavus]
MSIQAGVYINDQLAGILEKVSDRHYIFRYDLQYFNDPDCLSISLSLPKDKQEYNSTTLFPFFYGLLSEGINKQTQCRLLHIDENDHFGLLLRTAHTNTIGAITVKEIKDMTDFGQENMSNKEIDI